MRQLLPMGKPSSDKIAPVVMERPEQADEVPVWKASFETGMRLLTFKK
jgi:hypothetical protein